MDQKSGSIRNSQVARENTKYMNYYIFRHGETFVTRDKVEYEEHVVDAPILAEGIPAIKRLAQYLKDIETEFNVRSDFLRVEQTAEIITEITGKKFQVDVRLHDTLVPPVGAEEKYPETETKEEFIHRVKSFWTDLKNKNYQSVLIGTHGGVIAALKHFITEGEFSYEDIMDFPKPGVLTIVKDGKIEEMDFN